MGRSLTIRFAFWLAFAVAIGVDARQMAVAADGRLVIKAVDGDTGKPIAARMHLKNARGQPVKAGNAPFWKDHFVFEGQITLELPVGKYTFEMERGPEYLRRVGHFEIKDFADDTKTVDMKRFIEMSRHGWWSGDLHIHRPLNDIELLMKAEDLHMGPVITWWNAKNPWEKMAPPEKQIVRFDTDRFYHVMAGEDEREGGALLFFNMSKPLDITGAKREYPSPMTYVEAARKLDGVHIDIEKPFWWDVPVWLASGKADTIGLANNHQWRSSMLDEEAWGRPRDKSRFPSPLGNGRWSQAIYYHVLNCGLKIPPSAGSASGVLSNPVGYNRVYVHVDGEYTYEKWWEGLRAGRVVVTNGPLMRPLVEGKLPGHMFEAAAGEKVELLIGLNMATQDEVRYLEIVQDGRVVHEVRLEDWKKAEGRLPPVTFTESGWFLVRAVTTEPKTYRFASTGPYYVEIGGKPRISKASAQFFLDWARERAKRVKLDDPEQKAEVLRHHFSAEKFWHDMVDKANAP